MAIISVDLEYLGRRWGWFLVLGILLIVLGIIALVYTPAATLASVLILGWLMFFSGILKRYTHSRTEDGAAPYFMLLEARWAS